MKTIHISEKLHYLLKVKATNKGIPLKELVSKFLEKALDE